MSTRFISSAISELLATLALSVALTACGGSSQQPPPPPVPDFSLSASPVSASAVIGNTTSAVTVSVASHNGFSGSVDITLQGLPSGVNASPGSSFAVQSGGSQAVTFSVSGTAAIGIFQLAVSGTSGVISHSAQILLTTEPIVSVLTYQTGSMLYLESDSGTDASRIGLQTGWGGSIVEVSLNGTNFVNEHDTGREVQAAQYDGSAQYDGCAGCTGTFGSQEGHFYAHWISGLPRSERATFRHHQRGRMGIR
jgi:hypothetical protein